VIALEWRRHGNQKGISRLRFDGSAQITLGYGSMYTHIQVWLDDMNLAAVNGFNRVLIYINANYLFLACCKNSCSREANVAQANHGNSFKSHFHFFLSCERVSRIRAHAMPSP